MPFALFRAVHPFPSLLVSCLAVALVAVADRDAPSELYVTVGLTMLAFQCTIGLVNDLVDVAEDRQRKPWKPLARGAVSTRAALLVALIACVAGVALGFTLPFSAALVGLLGFGAGLLYDLWLKRTNFSWLPYSIAFPLLPLWVFLAAGAWTPLLWWALPLGASLGLALHLANEAPDVAEEGVQGLPAQLGELRSRLLAVGLFAAVAAVVVIVGLLYQSQALGIAAAVWGIGISGTTPFAARLGRDGLFGLLAVGSAILAAIFLLIA